MTIPQWLAERLSPEARPRALEAGLFSVLPEADAGAPYDGRAAAYDRAIGSKLYNRAIWGTTPRHYRSFIEAALRAARGPALDVAAGSCLESAAVYPECPEPVLVLDRSLDMLRRGMERLRARTGSIPAGVVFLQADAMALPLRSASFDTILCHGAFHVFRDPSPVCEEWARVLDAAGQLHVSSLVTTGRRGDLLLRLLERAGELTRRDAEGFAAELTRYFHGTARLRGSGSMAYLSITAGEEST